MPMIEIIYKCRCLKEEARFYVRPRELGEDVVAYVQGPVSRALVEDHSLRSPFCREPKTDYIKIYIADGAEGIGFAKPRGKNENQA